MVLTRDSAARELLGGQPRRWPLAVAGILIVAVVVATLLAAFAVADRFGDDQGGSAAPAANLPTAPESPPVSAPASEALVLPQPTSYNGIVPLGYPQSVPGAVAAAYGYSRIATGLDVEATLHAIEKLADPATAWYGRQRDALADGLVEQRRSLGLPPVGPVTSASLSVTPSGYQLLGRATSGTASVLTLNIVSATATDGTRTSGTVVLRWDLRWDGVRWLATRMYSDSEHDALAVTPLTSQARALGWQVATGG